MKKTTFSLIAFFFAAFIWQGTAQTYCTPERTDPGRYINSFSTTGGVENISNMNSGFSDLGYGDFTTMSVEAYLGENLNFEVAIEGGTAGFRIWVDWNLDGVFDTDDEVVYQSNEYANSHAGMFSIPSDAVPGATRMRIVSHWLSINGSIDPCETDFSYGEFEDYTINLLAPSCPAPSALAVSDVTTSEATLEWVENGAATEWKVVYGTAGFDHKTEGTTVSVIVTPFTLLTELEGSGQYDFYVKSICDESDESGFVEPYTFRTACIAIISLPYLENFDSYASDDGSFPACWERITYTSGSEVWPAILSQNAISGPNSLKFKSDPDAPTYAISPAFVENVINLQVTFMLQREGTSSGTIHVGVMSDASDTDTFELVQTITPTHNDPQEYTIDFNQASLSGSGNYIALRHNSNSRLFYYWLDDFEVKLSSSCQAPTALSTTNITSSTADVQWTAGGSETTWNVSWGTQGFTPGDSDEINTVVVTSTDYQITGLNAHTNYDVYVKAICDEFQSGWVSISFTSGGPECQSPLGITVNNVTENSAEITWSPANAGDNKWEISLTTGGQSADHGLIATVSETASYMAAGLASDTYYSVCLRTVCSEDVSSGWAFNGDFTTLEGTEEPDVCESPLGITVNNVSEYSAEVTWTPANEGDSQWAI